METLTSNEHGLSSPHSLKVSLPFTGTLSGCISLIAPGEDCSGRTGVSLCLLHCAVVGQLCVYEK